jgi:hypothetical protein
VETHYTAWMTNDPSCLSGPFMDVTVLEDEVSGYKDGEVTDSETMEREQLPQWTTKSGDSQMFHAETGVRAADGEAQDGIREAKTLLEQAGWRTVGEWEATPNSYTATVVRV